MNRDRARGTKCGKIPTTLQNKQWREEGARELYDLLPLRPEGEAEAGCRVGGTQRELSRRAGLDR